MILLSRHNLLFVGAVLLPSALVIALGVRMMWQEDELDEKRARERRQQALALIRQELLTRLEGLKLRTAAPSDPDIALSARVEGGRIVLPCIEKLLRSFDEEQA